MRGRGVLGGGVIGRGVPGRGAHGGGVFGCGAPGRGFATALLLFLLVLLSSTGIPGPAGAGPRLPDLTAECRWSGSLVPADAKLTGSWRHVDWQVRGAPTAWAAPAGGPEPARLAGAVSLRTAADRSRGLTLCAGSLRHRWGLGALWPSGQAFGGTERILRAYRRPLHEVATSTSRAVPRRLGVAALWRWARLEGGAVPAAGARGRQLALWAWRGHDGEVGEPAPPGNHGTACGVAFSSGAWGVSAGSLDDLKGSAWVGSVAGVGSVGNGEAATGVGSVLGGGAAGAAPGVVMFEVAGRYDRTGRSGPELAAGLVWALEPSRALGVCRGRVWTGPAEGLVAWRDARDGVWGTTLDPGFELVWDLPRRAGVRGQARLSVLHRSPDALGRSLQQHDARVGLATFLGADWSAEVRIRHSETLAALPADEREIGQALGRRARTSLDVRAHWSPPGEWTSSLRLLLTVGRSGRWALAAGDAAEEIAIDGAGEEAAGLLAAPPVEADADRAWPGEAGGLTAPGGLAAPGVWQAEQAGGATVLRVSGPALGSWRWGVIAAVTRAGSHGTCYVPLRRVPAHSVWKGLGEGSYLAQFHISRRIGLGGPGHDRPGHDRLGHDRRAHERFGHVRLGGALQWLARPHRDVHEAQLSLGVSWRSN